jgi:hypothetical protein
MRKLIAVAALLAATALPSTASAQIFAGARLGYGFPLGDVWQDAALKDMLKAQVPVTIDLGLKLGRALAVGAYASYGFGLLSKDSKDYCDAANLDCSATVIRVGVQANLHAANSERTEFWGGVTAGYSRLGTKEGGDEFILTGFEGGLQGGMDFISSPSLRIGPFASVTAGQYTKWDDGSQSGDVADFADTTVHGWIQIGVRGLFGS